MLLPPHQRRLLGAFLRSHRESLPADAAGRPVTGARRRTPGLRREEVADISGISATWYTWLEQGRDISVSAAALGRLALALRLSSAERAYLFELVRQRDPLRPESDAADEPRLALEPVLATMAAPAYLLDGRWSAVAWNGAAEELFGDWFGIDGRGLLDFMFLDERSRHLVPDWNERARRLAAEFRADLAGRPDDAAMAATIERLRRRSSVFAAFWSDHTVLSREGGLRLFDHPSRGRLRYRQVTLTPSAWPSHKLVVLVSAEDELTMAP